MYKVRKAARMFISAWGTRQDTKALTFHMMKYQNLSLNCPQMWPWNVYYHTVLVFQAKKHT